MRANGVEPGLGTTFAGYPPGADRRIETLECLAAKIFEGEQIAD